MAGDCNLLAGSLIGAWTGAEWATRLKPETLYRVIAVLLVVIAGLLLFTHDTVAGAPPFTGWIQVVVGIAAVFAIGVIASLLGVAGGELPNSDFGPAFRRGRKAGR